jgi:alpha-glucosidase (family GH31 glycosyl hydrolase)
MFLATQGLGGPVLTPLFFDYADDDKTMDVDTTTYMLGDAIKVSPVWTQGVKDGDMITSYFPNGDWVDLNDYKTIVTSDGGKDMEITSSLLSTSIHLAPNRIIPYQ